MIVTGKKELNVFTMRYVDAKSWIQNWLVDIEGSQFKNPQDIKNKYRTASFLPNDVVIFNVKGNKYRLETMVAYKFSVIDVIWIGTHEKYDRRNKSR